MPGGGVASHPRSIRQQTCRSAGSRRRATRIVGTEAAHGSSEETRHGPSPRTPRSKESGSDRLQNTRDRPACRFSHGRGSGPRSFARMAKRMLIDATHPEETRVVVLSGNRLEEFDFESSTKKQVKGNIYLAKITRVEPSLQAAFVDYGGNRHGFLPFSEIHSDYYRIPVSDRAPTDRNRGETDPREPAAWYGA